MARQDSVQPFRDKRGAWRCRMIAPNGRILFSGEDYTSGAQGCDKTIQGVLNRNPTIKFKPPAPKDVTAWEKGTTKNRRILNRAASRRGGCR